MTTIVRVEGHDWSVESVREAGNTLVVTVSGGQEIVTRGATAQTVRDALKPAEHSKEKSKKGR